MNITTTSTSATSVSPINHHSYTAVGLLAVVSVSTAFASPFPLTYRETRTGRHIPARPDVAGGDATGGGGERGKIAKRRRRQRKIWVCCLGCNTARKHVKRKHQSIIHSRWNASIRPPSRPSVQQQVSGCSNELRRLASHNSLLLHH